MLSDGLTAKQADGDAPETTEVIDVAQLLLESVRRGARNRDASVTSLDVTWLLILTST